MLTHHTHEESTFTSGMEVEGDVGWLGGSFTVPFLRKVEPSTREGLEKQKKH